MVTTAGMTHIMGVASSLNDSGTIQFVYTSPGSISNYFALGLAGANTLLISPAGTFSTTKVTGAVRVSGGLGVSGDIYVNSINSSSANVTTGGQIGSMFAPSLIAGNLIELDIGVDASIAGNSFAQAFFYAGSGSVANFYRVSMFGNTFSTKTFKNATASTSTSTGTFVVDGGLGVSGAVNSGGLGTFTSLTTNAGVNTFQYSQGTWTPTIVTNSGPFTSTGYTFNTGTWTKIGNMVTCTIQLNVTATGGATSTQVNVNGLPFPLAIVGGTTYQTWSLPETIIATITQPIYARGAQTSSTFIFVSATGPTVVKTDIGGAFAVNMAATFTYLST